MEAPLIIFVIFCVFIVSLIILVRINSRLKEIEDVLERQNEETSDLKEMLVQSLKKLAAGQQKTTGTYPMEAIPHEEEQAIQEERVTEPTVDIPIAANTEQLKPEPAKLNNFDAYMRKRAETHKKATDSTEGTAISAFEKRRNNDETVDSTAGNETGRTEEVNNGINYEKYIGENLFGKIGILVFIIGIGYFVKYAIDQNWINEVARTILGFAVGVGMLVLAERLHKRYHTFSSLLAGGAFGVFYLTVAIAFHYYNLFSQTSAFITLCGITLLMSGISILYNRSELAATALVGGFIAPFVVSTDAGSIITLFTYVSILNIGMFCLSIYKKWGLLPVIAFVFTYIILFFSSTGSLWGGQYDLATTLLGFSTLFYLIFLLPVFYILHTESKRAINNTLMSVIAGNSFLYLLYANWVLDYCPTPFKANGLTALFITLINLGLYLYLRLKDGKQDALRSLMQALTVIFAAITVPMQFDGSMILVSWSAEAVLLLWLFIKDRSRIYELGAVALAVLTLCYYPFTGMVISFSQPETPYTLFLNSHFMTGLFVSAAALAFALLIERYKEMFTDKVTTIRYSPHNAIAIATGITILIITFLYDYNSYFTPDISKMASYLTVEAILLISTLVLRSRFKIADFTGCYVALLCSIAILYMMAVWGFGLELPSDIILMQWMLTAIIVYHLFYVIRGLLHSSWQPKRVQMYCAALCTLIWLTTTRLLTLTLGITAFSTAFSLSLGIAAFILMCVGMRCHSKEIRIVSLAEFGLVIAKLILNDVWAMPAVGKIVVFISLGVILLTLSFLYQKLKDVLFGEEEQAE
ncbi:MAG: DUF2339 domain-containing protein [Prevotella sp.]|nr:DUF2339 domain-containing protein [Prevotella sp.]